METGTQSNLPTIITVTYNSWESYTSRLVSAFFNYVSPDEYKEWIIIDNNSEDGPKLAKAVDSFPIQHALKITIIHSDQNIGDLPQYNRIIPRFVSTEKIICISTDVRIFKPTIFLLSNLLDYYDMVGPAGPAVPKECADPALGGTWHWIPALLIKRGLDFENTAHAQTHCFAIRKSAFLEVGGFWEPEDGNYLDKGHLISAEVYMGTKIRRAGRKLALAPVPCYHYGNQMSSYEEMDQFDKHRGWDTDFARYI